MNRNNIIFKSQYTFEFVAKSDQGFTFNLAHDNDNKVTSIVWMIFICVIFLKDFAIIYQLM